MQLSWGLWVRDSAIKALTRTVMVLRPEWRMTKERSAFKLTDVVVGRPWALAGCRLGKHLPHGQHPPAARPTATERLFKHTGEKEEMLKAEAMVFPSPDLGKGQPTSAAGTLDPVDSWSPHPQEGTRHKGHKRESNGMVSHSCCLELWASCVQEHLCKEESTLIGN